MTSINQENTKIIQSATRAISEKGQTVIPKPFRDYLNVQNGDRLEWSINEEGQVVVTPKKKKSIMDLKGVVRTEKPIADMDQVIREAKEEHVQKRVAEGRL